MKALIGRQPNFIFTILFHFYVTYVGFLFKIFGLNFVFFFYFRAAADLSLGVGTTNRNSVLLVFSKKNQQRIYHNPWAQLVGIRFCLKKKKKNPLTLITSLAALLFS